MICFQKKIRYDLSEQSRERERERESVSDRIENHATTSFLCLPMLVLETVQCLQRIM